MMLSATLAGEWLRGSDVVPGDPQLLAVGICAHNEERVIGETVHRVTSQGAACYVLCDDCTDNTSAQVQLAGGQVVAGVYHSKAKALWHLICAMRADGYVRFSIIDADTEISEDYCRLMSGALMSHGVVQGGLRSLNADTWVAGWMAGQTAIAQRFAEWGRTGLGLPAVLCGTCWGLTWNVARRVPLLPVSVTEDLEYTYMLLESGIRVYYYPAAWGWNENVRDLRSVCRQMERWTRGAVQVWRREWRVIMRYPEMLMSVSMYPLCLLDFLVVGLALWNSLSALWWSAGGFSALAIVALLERGEGRRIRLSSYLLHPVIQLAVLGAEFIGVLRCNSHEWRRTEHYGEKLDRNVEV